ncbi:LysM peptidoglycan-binding domain-containing protein [Thalassococcus lentus]|uniref:Transporter substrate-binding domain-containing protein n=1 Tax=Thalassococcus lentus TaxID=1210524 RepID=A0ABT4XY82_9RHOB|nr:transporter substrate-binding domain-containing protein [Thalassococcus lentus]MDA7426778.1 transporter substrate-binding domain-containing protein [Thalassococcus lentus]
MTIRASAAAAAMLAASTFAAEAQQTCGGNYTVQRGDSLSLIADKLYKDAGQWTTIYRSNIDKIPSPNQIRVGQSYRLPCINGLPVGLEGGTVLQANAAVPKAVTATVKPQDRRAPARVAAAGNAGGTIRLLAGDDFKPFTNRLLLSSGLITELVNRSMVAASGLPEHKFVWVNDRSAHLDPMLSEGMVDLAFPWKKPDCTAAPNSRACTDYLYSEPLFEMLVVLFTSKDRPIAYNEISDLAGVRVCSPLGHGTLAQRGSGADYLSQVGARLQQPVTGRECFERLENGSVDAVALNEFTGRMLLRDMGLADKVTLELRRPLSIEGLHVVAHKSNPRAQEILSSFDSGLSAIRDSGEYVSVLDKHLSSIWSGL